MTIQEQLNAINATFVKLHKDFVRFEAEKKSLASRFSLEYSRVQQNGIRSVAEFLLSKKMS